MIDHQTWLERIAPELGVIYLLPFQRLPAWLLCDAVAFYNAKADLIVQSMLEASGEWRGRGHVVAMSQGCDNLPETEQRGVMLHEVAHAAVSCLTSRFRKDPAEFTEFETALLTDGGTARLMERFNLTPLPHSTLERLAHDSQFVRAGLHLWSRVAFTDEILLTEMRLTGQHYALDEDRLNDAVKCLAPELRRGGHLLDVLKTPAPSTFLKLFEAATSRTPGDHVSPSGSPGFQSKSGQNPAKTTPKSGLENAAFHTVSHEKTRENTGKKDEK